MEKKKIFGPSKPSTVVPNLPFMFVNRPVEEENLSTSSSYMKTTTDLSFVKELTKIGMPTLSILPINPAKDSEKNKFSPATSPTGRFPYQRKARSISPPKENLTICDRKHAFFFRENSPIVPDNSLQGNLPAQDLQADDGDLIALKQEYLKLIQQAPGLGFKSEIFDNGDEFSGTDEFDEWETSIMKKMQLH